MGVHWITDDRTEHSEHQYYALGELLPAFGNDHAKIAAEAWFRDLDRGVTLKADDAAVAMVKTACERYVKDRRLSNSECSWTRRRTGDAICTDKGQRIALLAACSDPVRDLAKLAMLTGCRAGELTSAARGAFGVRAATLRVTGNTRAPQ